MTARRVLQIIRDRLIIFSLIGILGGIVWLFDEIDYYRPAYRSPPPIDSQFILIAACVITLVTCLAWEQVDRKK